MMATPDTPTSSSIPDDYIPPPVAMAPQPSVNRRFATLRTISALILREMSATYGRSPGGYAWMILEPVLGVMVLTAIFSAGFRTPALGNNFAIYYATGLVPFQMFNAVSSKMSGALKGARSMLAYPGVTFMDMLLSGFLLTVLTHALISYLVISFIRTFQDTRTVFEFGRVLLGYTMLVSFGTGVGLLNGFLSMRYQLWGRIWSIITRPLVFISGVIFLWDNMPEPYKGWLWWNPLVHCIGVIRSGFYIHYDANYASPTYVFSVSAIVGVTGLLFLSRHYRDLLEI